MDETEEQNLRNIAPVLPGIKGKWYFDEPIMESLYVLIENSTDTMMLVYYPKRYSEINGEEQQVFSHDYEFPGGKDYLEDKEELWKVPGVNEYCIIPLTESSYRVNEAGELILLERTKTRKDTAHPVLQPLDL